MKRLVSFLVALTMVFCCMSAALGEPESNLWNGDTLLTLGTVNGNTYENQVMGYGCVLEGWSFANADDIAEMNNWAKDILTEDAQALIESVDSFMDMYASSEDGMCNVVVQFQNMGRIYGALLTEKMIVDISLPQLAPMLEQTGYEDVVAEAATIRLGDNDHAGFAVSGTFYGLPIYQKEVCILCGDYMGLVTVTSYFTDLTDEVFASFYSL